MSEAATGTRRPAAQDRRSRGGAVAEPLLLHTELRHEALRARVLELLELVQNRHVAA